VEFDVHLSADGVPVVHHDATLERMTDGTGPVGSRTVAELAQLRIKGTVDEGVPTLDEVLDLLAPGDLWLRIEIKPDPDLRPYPGLPGQVVAALEARGLSGRAGITSFLSETLSDPAVQESGLPRLALMAPMVFRCIGGLSGVERVLEMSGTRHMALPVGLVDAALLADAAARGLTLSAYGAHDAGQITRALELGLPVFTSDRPTLARQLRDGA